MNRRQKLKKLKWDNKLMRDIIRNAPQMEALYEAYNSVPKNITHTTMTFQQLKGYHNLPLGEELDGRIIEAYRDWLADDICKLAKPYIHFEVVNDGTRLPRVEANLFVGVRG